MVNDIVKQIILKFKSEGSEQAKKAVESIGKSFNVRDTERFLKTLDQVQQKFGRAGQSISTELKKVTDYFKELNNQHFQKAERNLDRMGRLIKNQIENIEKLKREGASADQIAAREATLKRATERFEQMADETPYIRPSGVRGMLQQIGGAPGRMGMTYGALNLLGGVAQSVGVVAGMRRDYLEQTARNRIEVANILKSQSLDVFAGNLSRAVVYGDPRRAKQINDDVKGLTRTRNIEEGAKALGGTTLGLGLLLSAAWTGVKAGGIAGTAFGGPIGTIIGGLVGGGAALGGAYLATRSFTGGMQYFKGGGQEAYRDQARRLAEQKAESQTMDLEYYKEFARNAEMRYNYQRQLYLGDPDAVDVRSRFRAAGVLNENQMAQSMLSFRRFGARNAPIVAAQTAEMAKQLGMSQEGAQQLMQTVAMINRGGIGSAKKDLEELFRRAVSAGVNDSGLIEEYQRAATGMMQALGTRMSAGDIANQMNSFMLGGADIRNIQAIQPAIQAFGQTMKGVSPLMQAKGISGILDLSRDDSGNVNMLAFQYLSQMTPQELATLNEKDPVLQQMGVTPDKIRTYKSRQAMGTLKANLGAVAGLKLLDKAKTKNAILTEGEQRMLAVGFGMQNVAGQDIRTVQSFLKANFQTIGGAGEGVTFAGPQGNVGLNTIQTMTPEQVMAEIQGTTTGIASGKQIAQTAKDRTEEDIRINERIARRIDDILSIYTEQSKEVMKNIDQGILAGPIQGIADAADKISEAMIRAANKIDGGNRPTIRTSAKSAGEGE